MATPIHGPSFIAQTSVRSLKVLCVAILLVFACLTVSETLQAFSDYNAEPGLIEAALVHHDAKRSTRYTAICFDHEIDNLRGSAAQNHIHFKKVNVRDWTSVDNSVLPDIGTEPGMLSLLYTTMANLQTILMSEMTLPFPLHKPDARAKFYGIEVWKALDYFLKYELPETANQVRAILNSPVHRFWVANHANFSALYRTGAVLLCKLVHPSLRIGALRLDAEDICRKSNVRLEFNSKRMICTARNRKQILDSLALFFNLDVAHLQRPRDPLKDTAVISLDHQLQLTSDDRVVPFYFGLCYFVECMQQEFCHRFDTQNASKLLTVVYRGMSTPIIYEAFQRRGSVPCWTTDDGSVDVKDCYMRCTYLHMSDTCTCHVTNLFYFNSTETHLGQNCSSDTRKDVGLLNCFKDLNRTLDETRRECYQECDEGMCRRTPFATLAEKRISVHELWKQNSPVLRRNRKTLTMKRAEKSYKIFLREYAAMNSTDLFFRVGGILGVWTGSTLLACLHLVLSAVQLLFRSKPVAKGGEETAETTRNDCEPPVDSVHEDRNVYFHFFPSALVLPRRLLELVVFAFCGLSLAIHLSEAVAFVQGYLDQQPVTGVTFSPNKFEILDPALCFEFDIPLAEMERMLALNRCQDVEEFDRVKASYFCHSTLMRLEQAIFMPESLNSTLWPHADQLSKCVQFLNCSGDDETTDLVRKLSSSICKQMNLVLTANSSQLSGFCYQTEEYRWLGPYAPHCGDAVCFGIPRQAIRHLGLTLTHFPSELFASTALKAKARNDMYVSTSGFETFLKLARRQRPLEIIEASFWWTVPEKDHVRLMQIQVEELYEAYNFSGEPCFDERSAFECERRCRRAFLLDKCNHSAISFSVSSTLADVLRGLSSSVVQCMKEIGNFSRADSALNRCMKFCGQLKPCKVFISSAFHAQRKRIEWCDHEPQHCTFFRHIIAAADTSTMEIKQLLMYPNIESVVSAIGGSMGCWIGGSIFAAFNILFILVECAISRCKKRSRSTSDEVGADPPPLSIATAADEHPEIAQSPLRSSANVGATVSAAAASATNLRQRVIVVAQVHVEPCTDEVRS